jgi:hypothetical protein
MSDFTILNCDVDVQTTLSGTEKEVNRQTPLAGFHFLSVFSLSFCWKRREENKNRRKDDNFECFLY